MASVEPEVTFINPKWCTCDGKDSRWCSHCMGLHRTGYECEVLVRERDELKALLFSDDKASEADKSKAWQTIWTGIQDNKDLRAKLAIAMEALEALPILGCGDNSCMFVKPAGMSTNGGCRCLGEKSFYKKMTALGSVLNTARQAVAKIKGTL